MAKYRLIFGLLLFNYTLVSQNEIPIESWRTHFSYRDANGIALTEHGVFCAGPNSLFFLDLQDHSLNRISKIDGLSDSEISAIAYQTQLSKLVIAYENGNIDLLEDNHITNISTVLEAPISQPKSIVHVTFKENTAYLSAEFGVVVLDLVKNEVTESYTKIGENGESIGINFATVFQDTLFLASEQGVIAGSLDPANNLQDFRNWYRFDSSDGVPNLPISTIASTPLQLLTTIGTEGIYVYQSGAWDKANYTLQNPVKHAAVSANNFLLTTLDKIILMDANREALELHHPSYPKPQSSIMNGAGLWVADSLNGLIVPNSGHPASTFPTGPFSDSISQVFYEGGIIISLPPGYDALRNPLRTKLGFYSFLDGEWTNYNSSGRSNTESFPAINDLVDVSYNRQHGKYYFASFGEGIVVWEPDGEVEILNDTSPGSTLANLTPGGPNVFISSVCADDSGNIWATNFGNSNPIHQYNPTEGTWAEYAAAFPAGSYPLDIEIASNGDMWLRLDRNHGGGIMVFNSESTLQKHLTDIDGSGGLPTRNIKDLIIDKNGQVWVGTNIGVTHYPFPFDILVNPVVNASPVLIDGRPLLRDENIQTMAIDGGNRKWIGTENGIWLFNEHGDSVIHHFTSENSPLPSNNILDVEVNDNNGEVFIVTENGTISFRGTATEGLFEHKQVRIFPNPVTRDFSGLVGISGLVNQAVVKITDVTGKLVNEVKANGGTAVWDISDFQGRRVVSGVYLVFSSSLDGNEAFIGKIAVIN